MKRIAVLVFILGCINVYADSLKYNIMDNNFSNQIVFDNETLSNFK